MTVSAAGAAPAGSGSVKWALRAPGIRPATGSSGSSSPSQRTRLRASRSRSVRVVEPREKLLRRDRVAGARPRLEVPRSRLRALGRQRAEVAAEIERPGGVVAHVTQRPPAARGPARAVVVGEHERPGVDPGAGEDLCEPRVVRQRVAATDGGIRPDRREVCLRVEVDGAGDVARLVRGPGPDVHEHDVHRAPRGATSSSTTSWSGNRALRSAAQAARSETHAITVGPEPDSVAPAHPGGRLARTASRTSEGR